VAINVRQQKSVEKEKPYPPNVFFQFLGIEIMANFKNVKLRMIFTNIFIL
jgi:hypothetical protein